MISCYEIQTAYIELYSQLRNYIWGFSVVDAIADLEIACYQTCPDLHNIRKCLDTLTTEISEVIREDTELKDALSAMRDLIDSADSTYVKLNKVREVISTS